MTYNNEPDDSWILILLSFIILLMIIDQVYGG